MRAPRLGEHPLLDVEHRLQVPPVHGAHRQPSSGRSALSHRHRAAPAATQLIRASASPEVHGLDRRPAGSGAVPGGQPGGGQRHQHGRVAAHRAPAPATRSPAAVQLVGVAQRPVADGAAAAGAPGRRWRPAPRGGGGPGRPLRAARPDPRRFGSGRRRPRPGAPSTTAARPPRRSRRRAPPAASTSRLVTPTTPIPSPWASPLAVATPTRSPVNSPGPTSTAIALDVARGPPPPAPAPASIAGRQGLGVAAPAGDRHARRARPRRRRPPRRPSRSPTRCRAAITGGPAANGATAAAQRPARGDRPSPARAAGERHGAGPRRSRPSRGERDLRARSSPRTGAPTSPHSTSADRAVLHQLAEREVGHLGQAVEPVEVGVDQLAHPAAAGTRYWRTSVNVGLVTGPSTPRAAAKPWANTVLPAPSPPIEQHEVARPALPGERGRQRAGRVGAVGAGAQHPGAAHPRSSSARRAGRLGARQQPLRPDQVGPHLGDHLAAGAQRERRVVGGDEVAAAGTGTRVPRSDLIPSVVPSSEAGGEVPEGDHHGRVDELDLGLEVGAAGLDLLGGGVPVLRRPALHHVGDVAAAPVDRRAPRASAGRAACPERPTNGSPARSSSRPAPRRRT